MRKHVLTGAVLAAAMLAAAEPARACMWDSDTIAEERSKFPTAMEILAGKYNRHSPAFYEWRIQDRRKKLEKDPNNPALLDDLGVALCKTGKFKEAVEIGEREVALDPKRYESQSNLGTFYIFAGDLDKSAEHIRAALAINPDAHFGREKYQLKLVEYMLEVKKVKGDVKLPLRMTWPEYGTEEYKALDSNDQSKFEELRREGFLRFCNLPPLANQLPDRTPAIIGVLGMMRFANDELPVLNEAAGDLFNPSGHWESDKQLAARAYLKASYHAQDQATATAYRTLAKRSLSMQTGITLEALEADFKDELAQGDAWMKAIAANEAKWIASSSDPEREFNKTYRDEPELDVHSRFTLSPIAGVLIFLSVFFVAITGIIIAIIFGIRSFLKRRKAAKTAAGK